MIGAVVLAASIALGSFVLVRRVASVTATLPEPAASSSGPMLTTPGIEARLEPPAESGELAGVKFARDFWGERWAEVEADLRARGKLKDWREPPSVPWEAAAVEFGERLFPLKEAERKEIVEGNLLQWDGVVDARWLREVLGTNAAVTPEQVERIREIAARHNVDAEPLAQEWAERLDFEIRGAWRAGRYEYGPFALPKGTPGPYIWTGGHAHEGWIARMQLSFEDCPGLEEKLREVRQRIQARNAEMLAVLAGSK